MPHRTTDNLDIGKEGNNFNLSSGPAKSLAFFGFFRAVGARGAP